MTKETEKNQTYEVQPGDTLSVIANGRGYYVDEVLALNPGLTRDATLHLGDEIVISVPEPELSVLTTEQSTYEEDYDAETQYIENDSWYTTQQVVRQEAVPGHHEVTVLTTSKNGTETSREMVSENVITEPVPEIIEKGTQTPPTYIKPITGGTLTSTFKWRWGQYAQGNRLGSTEGNGSQSVLRRYRRQRRLVWRVWKLYHYPSSGRQTDPLRSSEQDSGICRTRKLTRVRKSP